MEAMTAINAVTIKNFRLNTPANKNPFNNDPTAATSDKGST